MRPFAIRGCRPAAARPSTASTRPPSLTWAAEVQCSCDTLVTIELTLIADETATGGIRRAGITSVTCPECDGAVVVPDCDEAGHVMGEVVADGVSRVACLVCVEKRRPLPVLAGGAR